MQTPVTESEFSVQLKCLNHKLNLIKELQFKDAKSTNDMKDILSKLKIKAMSKIRIYLLEQIYKFRKPMTNYQVPQNVMLKNKFFFEFILCNERQVGQEICNEYVDTMSKIYYSYFKVTMGSITLFHYIRIFGTILNSQHIFFQSYSTRLSALLFEDAISIHDMMGIEELGNKQSIFTKTAPLRNRGTTFTIGKRGEILNQQLEAAILVPHAQQKTRVRRF